MRWISTFMIVKKSQELIEHQPKSLLMKALVMLLDLALFCANTVLRFCLVRIVIELYSNLFHSV